MHGKRAFAIVTVAALLLALALPLVQAQAIGLPVQLGPHGSLPVQNERVWASFMKPKEREGGSSSVPQGNWSTNVFDNQGGVAICKLNGTDALDCFIMHTRSESGPLAVALLGSNSTVNQTGDQQDQQVLENGMPVLAVARGQDRLPYVVQLKLNPPNATNATEPPLTLQQHLQRGASLGVFAGPGSGTDDNAFFDFNGLLLLGRLYKDILLAATGSNLGSNATDDDPRAGRGGAMFARAEQEALSYFFVHNVGLFAGSDRNSGAVTFWKSSGGANASTNSTSSTGKALSLLMPQLQHVMTGAVPYELLTGIVVPPSNAVGAVGWIGVGKFREPEGDNQATTQGFIEQITMPLYSLADHPAAATTRTLGQRVVFA